MAATMTDVQHAIDQLGANRAGSVMDDGRSMSFASTRTDRTSVDGDHYRAGEERMSMFDEGDDLDDVRMSVLPENWHRDARRRLFERVDQMHPDEEDHHRPPVGGEFSDESDDEDGHHHGHAHHRHNKSDDHGLESPKILRSDSPAKAESTLLAPSRTTTQDSEEPKVAPIVEENTDRAATPTPAPSSTSHSAPTNGVSNEEIPIAKKVANGVSTGSPTPATNQGSIAQLQIKDGQTGYLPELNPATPFTPIVFNSSEPPTATSPKAPYIAEKPAAAASTAKDKAAAVREKGVDTKGKLPLSHSSSYVSFLPSPTTTSFNTAQSQSGNTLSSIPPGQSVDSTPQQRSEPQQLSSNPSASVSQTSIPATTTTQTTQPSTRGGDADHEGASLLSAGDTSMKSTTSLAPPVTSVQASPKGEKKKVPPSEWTVDQVVEWAKSKGFDDGICNKFIGKLATC